jgi:hypothetical protein
MITPMSPAMRPQGGDGATLPSAANGTVVFQF